MRTEPKAARLPRLPDMFLEVTLKFIGQNSWEDTIFVPSFKFANLSFSSWFSFSPNAKLLVNITLEERRNAAIKKGDSFQFHACFYSRGRLENFVKRRVEKVSLYQLEFAVGFPVPVHPFDKLFLHTLYIQTTTHTHTHRNKATQSPITVQWIQSPIIVLG